jgi:hypothetical protein
MQPLVLLRSIQWAILEGYLDPMPLERLGIQVLVFVMESLHSVLA